MAICRKCKHELSQHLQCNFCRVVVCAHGGCKCFYYAKTGHSNTACLIGTAAAKEHDKWEEIKRGG